MNTQTSPLFEVRDLTRNFREGNVVVPAVDHVSFKVQAGEIVSIVGESGSGKSTLARLLLQLTQPTSGQILLAGDDITRLRNHGARKAYWRQVQGIFQDPFASFNQFYSVDRMLAKTLALRDERQSGDERRQIIAESLRRVGLDPGDVLQKSPHQLSGGQLQRVTIARALLVEPDVLIADESTSMLDASLRVNILNLLMDLRDESGLTVLFITHEIGQAYYVSDRMMVMYQGQMVEQGEVTEVLRSPQHEYTQRLLADVPRLHGSYLKAA